jgi:hypothetical protein
MNSNGRAPWLSLVAATCVVAGSLAGCANDTVKAPGSGRSDPLPHESYPQIAALEGLDKWVYFDRPVIDKGGSVIKVTVPARAATDGQELNVQYRFFWLDASGRPLDNTPDWHYQRMPSRSQVFFEGNALDKTAEDWRLEIRPGR